jgi:hypothetical protein
MSESTQQQRSRIFRVENWFRWVIDAHKLGYSDADILFVLDTVGVHEGMKRILEGESQKQSH